jgi:hypothetical protein
MGAIQNLYPENLLLRPYKWVYGADQGLVVDWDGPDNQELFELNCKKQPPDWYYRTHKVSYQFNSNNYRCPEWSDIVWEDSWVMMGCSLVEGVGLAIEDCISSQLSQMINAPVINLGVGASGLDVTMFNTIRLIKHGIRPKGVVLFHGVHNLSRLAIFSPSNVTMLGTWILDRPQPEGFRIDTLYKLWTTHPDNAEAHSEMCLEGSIALWKNANIPVFSVNISEVMSGISDHARDLMHPGRATANDWAQRIASSLPKL